MPNYDSLRVLRALPMSQLLNVKIEVLGLAKPTIKQLQSAKIQIVQDLLSQSEVDLLRIRGFGRVRLHETKKILALLGLCLSHSTPPEIPEGVETMAGWAAYEAKERAKRRAKFIAKQRVWTERRQMKAEHRQMAEALHQIRTYLRRGYVTMNKLDTDNLMAVVERGLGRAR